MRKIAAFLISLLFLVNMLSLSIATENAPLIIMIYMTGSDLESGGGAASADLDEMMQFIPDTGNIRVIAMISGSNKWRNGIPGRRTKALGRTPSIANKSLTEAHRTSVLHRVFIFGYQIGMNDNFLYGYTDFFHLKTSDSL